MNERQRVSAAYARRAALGLDSRYDYWEPANLFIFQERERLALALLRRYGLLPLGRRRVLDLGCGEGGVLRDLLRYGAQPDCLVGLDLLPERIAAARRANPGIDVLVGDVTALPFADRTFDLLLAFTLFSSILDANTRSRAATEALRVLRPDGSLLWYDFWINPVNRDVRPMPLRELRRLFPGCIVEARRVTLAPPLARALVPRWRAAASALSAVPWLRTHWLALITRRPGAGERRGRGEG
jgi:SAM-dependent methyltransferase